MWLDLTSSLNLDDVGDPSPSLPTPREMEIASRGYREWHREIDKAVFQTTPGQLTATPLPKYHDYRLRLPSADLSRTHPPSCLRVTGVDRPAVDRHPLHPLRRKPHVSRRRWLGAAHVIMRIHQNPTTPVVSGFADPTK